MIRHGSILDTVLTAALFGIVLVVCLVLTIPLLLGRALASPGE